MGSFDKKKLSANEISFLADLQFMMDRHRREMSFVQQFSFFSISMGMISRQKSFGLEETLHLIDASFRKGYATCEHIQAGEATKSDPVLKDGDS